MNEYIFTTGIEHKCMDENDVNVKLDELEEWKRELLRKRDLTESYIERKILSAKIHRLDKEKVILENLLEGMRF